MSYHEYPLGCEPAPYGKCHFCNMDVTGLDWDHYDYHLLAKHFEVTVIEFSVGYDREHLVDYRNLLLAKKQRLQKFLGL